LAVDTSEVDGARVQKPRIRGKRGRGGSDHRQVIGRYDQALRNAKNEGKLVQFCLAVEAPCADEDCTVTGQVHEVDKFDVAVIPVSAQDRTIWIKKSAIVTTEVLA
jgi:hypothetical protein